MCFCIFGFYSGSKWCSHIGHDLHQISARRFVGGLILECISNEFNKAQTILFLALTLQYSLKVGIRIIFKIKGLLKIRRLGIYCPTYNFSRAK